MQPLGALRAQVQIPRGKQHSPLLLKPFETLPGSVQAAGRLQEVQVVVAQERLGMRKC